MTQKFKIAAVQINPLVGDVRGNAEKIIINIRHAKAVGADLVVFPELVVSGYPPEDLILKPSFLKAVDHTISLIAKETQKGTTAVLLGAPHHDRRGLFNALFFLRNGKIKSLHFKHHLPNYGVFDEKRIFNQGRMPTPIAYRGLKLGVMICEDMWFPDIASVLKQRGANILIAPHGSPYEDTKRGARLFHARARVRETRLPLLLVNQVGGQDELVFDGASFALNAQGQIASQLHAFTEDFAVLTFEKQGRVWRLQNGSVAEIPESDEQLYTALMCGLRDYVQKNKFNNALIGLSGGIDSALTAALAVDALGSDRVSTVMMPSSFTRKISIISAREVANNLGVAHSIVPIHKLVAAYSRSLSAHFRHRPVDTTEENIQARIRGMILMALSNKFGHMVLATGNKSEMSVGYSTLYGDLCGGFAILKDVYKTKVYDLARWRNNHVPKGALGPKKIIVPEIVFKRAPSAELKANQTDQDTLPPYSTLDKILQSLIEDNRSVSELTDAGYDTTTVAKIESMIYSAEYKRRQAPPGVKVTRCLFGRDRRYPITNAFRDKPTSKKHKNSRS